MTISFTRLTEVDPDLIAEHMSHPRMAEHMPLLTNTWGREEALAFIAAKEACWTRDGLGHWAFLDGDTYLGWGGFQREGDEWDFGLVLHPDHFGRGTHIARVCLAFANYDPRLSFVTFLLPPSRKHLGALRRLGAEQLDQVTYDGETFMKFRLETTGAPTPVSL